MNESVQEAPVVDSKDASEEGPTMEDAEDNSSYDTEEPADLWDTWAYGDWESYGTRSATERAAVKVESMRAGLRAVRRTETVATLQHVFQVAVSLLLLVGAIWALLSVLVLLTSESFFEQATTQLLALDITDSADVLYVTTLLSPPVLLALLGFALLGLAIRISRYPVIQRSLAGVSAIQHELAAGTGETRPLVQVVQETINNARQTFAVKLRLSQAMFWIGMLFLVVTLWRAVGMDKPDTLSIGVTVGTGTMGILGWLFSYLISQNKQIQANLADVTQLELGLVGIAKQVGYIDLWLGNVLLEPYLIGEEGVTISKQITSWGLQEVQRYTFAAAGLVELYAQVAEGEAEEQKERRRLLNQAVQIHAGLAEKPAELVKVPDLVKDGKTTKAHAAKQLEVEGLKPKWEPVDAAEDWIVTSQDPPRDQEVPKGLEVTVKLKKPAELVKVPDLVKDGKTTKAYAAKQLKAEDLKPKWEPADAADDWIVSNQAPAKDTQVVKGSDVTVKLKQPGA